MSQILQGDLTINKHQNLLQGDPTITDHQDDLWEDPTNNSAGPPLGKPYEK